MTVAQTRWHGLPDPAAIDAEAARRILACAEAAIAARGRFLLVLAGGSTPRGTYARLARADADWTRWHVFYGDERCLPADNPARNSRMARNTLLDHVPVPREQHHPIPAELGPAAGAARYSALLAGIGAFDCVLLGLGEDGHTASLFPGLDPGLDPGAQRDAPDVMAVCNAPKPPPGRISLSARRLSRARSVLFLVSGERKRAAVMRWRAADPIPAAAIRPPGGVDVLIEAALLRR